MTSKARSVAVPFLMSMVALPACGPTVDDDDPTVPDGGDPDKLEESCRAQFETLGSCYQEVYGEAYEGYEAYDISEYAEEVCGELAADVRDTYGEACLGAFEEVFACLASVDCGTLIDGWEGDFPEPCLEVGRDASERCPEAFPACSGGSSGFSGGACDTSSGACLDGHTYAIACEEDGPALACSCSVDGEETQALSVAGSCGAAPWGELQENCGFPEF